MNSFQEHNLQGALNVDIRDIFDEGTIVSSESDDVADPHDKETIEAWSGEDYSLDELSSDDELPINYLSSSDEDQDMEPFSQKYVLGEYDDDDY
uniref:Uncharacterized protein n=1 Tax=Arundo donax TaxID=35708 RepID=A0A0A9BW78_ARUDO